jgi:hypothetical protein
VLALVAIGWSWFAAGLSAVVGWAVAGAVSALGLAASARRVRRRRDPTWRLRWDLAAVVVCLVPLVAVSIGALPPLPLPEFATLVVTLFGVVVVCLALENAEGSAWNASWARLADRYGLVLVGARGTRTLAGRIDGVEVAVEESGRVVEARAEGPRRDLSVRTGGRTVWSPLGRLGPALSVDGDDAWLLAALGTADLAQLRHDVSLGVRIRLGEERLEVSLRRTGEFDGELVELGVLGPVHWPAAYLCKTSRAPLPALRAAVRRDAPTVCQALGWIQLARVVGSDALPPLPHNTTSQLVRAAHRWATGDVEGALARARHPEVPPAWCAWFVQARTDEDGCVFGGARRLLFTRAPASVVAEQLDALAAVSHTLTNEDCNALTARLAHAEPALANALGRHLHALLAVLPDGEAGTALLVHLLAHGPALGRPLVEVVAARGGTRLAQHLRAARSVATRRGRGLLDALAQRPSRDLTGRLSSVDPARGGELSVGDARRGAVEIASGPHAS